MQYGKTFPAELIAAGVGGLPFSWDASGAFCFDDSVTPEQRAVVQAVAAAHNPNPLPTHADLVATVLNTARDLRTKLFAVVDGLQASALATGNTSDATSIEVFKTGIRNITLIDLSAATTLVQMQAIITAQYKVLAAAAPLSVQLAFRQALQ